MTPKKAVAELEHRNSNIQKAVAIDRPRHVEKIEVDYYHNSFHEQRFLYNGRKAWKPAKPLSRADL